MNVADTYLLTWNPRRSPEGNLIQAAVSLEPGTIVRNWQWSCGNNKNIQIGSRVFLLRQGNQLPGIVASGWITKKTFHGPHWDLVKRKRGIRAKYIKIVWDELVLPEKCLPKSQLLKGILPATLLKSAASGVRVPHKFTKHLEHKWRTHLKKIPQISYWVVSPNVRNNESTVSDWRRASNVGQAAFMGWHPNDRGHGQIGSKFAGNTENGIKPGDIILIARRHNFKPEMVGFGVVYGKFAKRLKNLKTPETFGSLRHLKPFVSWSGLPPNDIPIGKAVKHTKALVRLDPDRDGAHKKICQWLSRQLFQEKPNPPLASYRAQRKKVEKQIQVVSSPQNHQLDYVIQTKAKIKIAQKTEALLLEKYQGDIADQGREIVALKYGKLQCDAFEKERQNLIEAKNSSHRENIRMAVGQLLDYAFLAKVKFKRLRKAILLPNQPNLEIMKWLDSLTINVIWYEKGVFVDNANGQFT